MTSRGATVELSLIAYSNELAAIQQSQAQLREAEAAIKTRIADLLAGQVGDIVAGGRTVFTVSYARRFDPALAATVLDNMSPEVREACSTTVIDSAKAKAVLAPAIYEMCQAQSTQPTIKPKAAQ